MSILTDAEFSALSTGRNLSKQYCVEEAVYVVECALLVGTVFSGRRAGSIAPRPCKRNVSVQNFGMKELEDEPAHLLQGFG